MFFCRNSTKTCLISLRIFIEEKSIFIFLCSSFFCGECVSFGDFFYCSIFVFIRNTLNQFYFIFFCIIFGGESIIFYLIFLTKSLTVRRKCFWQNVFMTPQTFYNIYKHLQPTPAPLLPHYQIKSIVLSPCAQGVKVAELQ